MKRKSTESEKRDRKDEEKKKREREIAREERREREVLPKLKRICKWFLRQKKHTCKWREPP